MTQAAVGQAGVSAALVNTADAGVAQAGLLAVTQRAADVAVAGAGVLATGQTHAKAAVAGAGVMVFAKFKQPYAVGGAGLLAFERNQAGAAVAGAGVNALLTTEAAAAVAAAGVMAFVQFVPPPSAPPAVAPPARVPGAPVDVMLAFNPALGCCDVVFNGTDFALDTTQASAVLFSLLANRRASADDILPTPVPDWQAPQSFFARQGYPGDALSPSGTFTGSKLWLYERSLANEATRQGVEAAVADAVGWIESVRGNAVQVLVRYIAPQLLGYRVRIGKTIISLTKALDS
jgi:phage gp46-like protein